MPMGIFSSWDTLPTNIQYIPTDLLNSFNYSHPGSLRIPFHSSRTTTSLVFPPLMKHSTQGSLKCLLSSSTTFSPLPKWTEPLPPLIHCYHLLSSWTEQDKIFFPFFTFHPTASIQKISFPSSNITPLDI